MVINKPVKTPTVIQFEAAECGAASLAIVLGYYGKWIPLSQLRVALGVSRDGTNILTIRDYAQTLGFNVKGKRFSIDSLKDEHFPFICHWEDAHFLVVEGLRDGDVYLSDPATGRRHVSLSSFDQSTPTKIMLELQPSSTFVKEGHAPSIWLGLYKRLYQYRKVIISLGILSAITTIPTIGLAAITSTLIDTVFIQDQQDFLNGLTLLSVVMIGLLLPSIRLEKAIFRKFGLILSQDMSLAFITKLLKLPISFFEARHNSEINQRLSVNQSVAATLTSSNGEAVVNIVSMSIYAIFLVLICWPLALVCFSIQSIQIFIIRSSELQRTENSVKLSQAQGELFATTYDSLRTIETIKSSAIEDQIFRRWSGQHAKFTNYIQTLTNTSNKISLAGQVINDILTITMLIGGGLLVINGYLAIGWLISFRQVYSSFSQPLIEITNSWSQLEQLFGDVNKLDDVLDEPVDPNSSIKGLDLTEITESSPYKTQQVPKAASITIEIKNLVFSFGGADQKIVDGISLVIPAGCKLGMVGSTGCGKSTLMRLIAGIYQPTEGSILYNGKDLVEFGVDRWHESVAYVTQFTQILPGTIYDNVRLFNNNISRSSVIKACQAACIHDDILLMPDGYDTKTQHSGFKLSGGQRQRLNIARALVRNPKILLLDEATSALDAQTEESIVSHLNEMDCTQIIIAHRINTIVNCDEIVYLDQGHVLEHGTHKDLLLRRGSYSALVDVNSGPVSSVTSL